MNPPSSVAIHLLLPVGVITAFFALSYYHSGLPLLFWDMLPAFFYIFAIVAVGVSWHYNRSRFIFIVLPLILLFWTLNVLDQAKTSYLVILLPVIIAPHLILFLFLKERGLFSVWGLLKLLFVGSEIALIAFLLYTTPQIPPFFESIIFDEQLTHWTTLPDAVLILTLITLLFFLLMSFIHHQVIYQSAFGGIFFLIMAGLHYHSHTPQLALAFLGVVVLVFGVLLKESYRLAFYDELTNLPGRRALIEDMAKLGRKYALAMVDIDHFKKFNDTYGHDTGDDVLKMVSAILGSVGGGGKAYRYGGEEFTVLFPSKSADHAFTEMDKLRHTIASTPFTVRNTKGKQKGKNRTVHIRISSGVVEKEREDKDPFSVMKRADNGLYKAKKQGRNKVVKG